MLQGQVSTGEQPAGPEQPKEVNDEISEAVSQVMGTMYGVSASEDTAMLGPTPTTVLLDDIPVRALLDTGFPSSIVSLEFYLKTAAEKRNPSQTPSEWGEAIRAQFQPNTVILRSYSGGELKIISQVQCRVARGNREVNAILQVQKEAPVDLLLGTDILSQLRCVLTQLGQEHAEDLLISRD